MQNIRVYELIIKSWIMVALKKMMLFIEQNFHHQIAAGGTSFEKMPTKKCYFIGLFVYFLNLEDMHI